MLDLEPWCLEILNLEIWNPLWGGAPPPPLGTWRWHPAPSRPPWSHLGGSVVRWQPCLVHWTGIFMLLSSWHFETSSIMGDTPISLSKKLWTHNHIVGMSIYVRRYVHKLIATNMHKPEWECNGSLFWEYLCSFVFLCWVSQTNVNTLHGKPFQPVL